MPKAILEYDLNDVDDEMSHMRAIKSFEMAMVLWEIVNNMKKGVEYSIDINNLSGQEALDAVYEKIYLLLEGHNISINELIR